MHNVFCINLQYNASVLYYCVISAYGKVVWILQILLPVVLAILMNTVINTVIELFFWQNANWMFALNYIEAQG